MGPTDGEPDGVSDVGRTDVGYTDGEIEVGPTDGEPDGCSDVG